MIINTGLSVRTRVGERIWVFSRPASGAPNHSLSHSTEIIHQRVVKVHKENNLGNVQRTQKESESAQTGRTPAPHSRYLTEHKAHFFGFQEDDLRLSEVSLEKQLLLL